MLPVTHGVPFTCRRILMYAAALVAVRDPALVRDACRRFPGRVAKGGTTLSRRIFRKVISTMSASV